MQTPIAASPTRCPTVNRLIMAAMGLCLAGLLGSCAGTGSENQFSAYVADHWPHWAGGMPADVPPRQGTPGYSEFIAHGQADPDAMPAIASAPATGAPAKPVMQTALPPPAAPAVSQAEPPAQSVPQAAADDPSVVRGGLY